MKNYDPGKKIWVWSEQDMKYYPVEIKEDDNESK